MAIKSKISTSELFHFTRFDNMIGIIENGFYPSYNLEHTMLSDLYSRPAAVQLMPMVCFCDLPLSLTGVHIEKYGRCAIGLRKEWGKKRGINPVIYVQENSMLGDAIATLANGFEGYHSSMIGKDGDIQIAMMVSQHAIGVRLLSCFVKQYENTEEKVFSVNGQHHKLEVRRFYDEREWRWIPPQYIHEVDLLMNINDCKDIKKLTDANLKIRKFKLDFNIDDIQCIITETKEQRLRIVDCLTRKYGIGLSEILGKIDFSSEINT